MIEFWLYTSKSCTLCALLSLKKKQKYTLSLNPVKKADDPIQDRNRSIGPIYRHNTTLKTARNMKSVSQTKVLNFKEIFTFWTHEQQDLTLLQPLIIFASQNLAALSVKWPWNGLHFSCTLQCCMWSIAISFTKSYACFISLVVTVIYFGYLWCPAFLKR